jgi:hypothetical protein
MPEVGKWYRVNNACNVLVVELTDTYAVCKMESRMHREDLWKITENLTLNNDFQPIYQLKEEGRT